MKMVMSPFINGPLSRFSRTILVPGGIVMAMLVGLTGCIRDRYYPVEKTRFGGPAEVTLILEGAQGTNSSGEEIQTRSSYDVDEANTIHTLKIFAFKHDPGTTQNDEMVGYGYWNGISGAGPHYCTMKLTASGEIDFYVIANDRYAVPADNSGSEVQPAEEVPDENSTRSEIENFRFSSLYSVEGEKSAVPMTNIIGEGGTDENNFTFNVSEGQNGVPEIIPIDITRTMARLSFFFAKGDNRTITIDKILLRGQGPVSAGYFTVTGDPGYPANTDNNPGSETVLDSREEITTVNAKEYGQGVTIPDSELQELEACAYLLPNIHGSVNPDYFSSQGSSEEKFSYILDITYSIAGTQKTKTVYLPPVDPNDWIKVKGIFKGTPVNVGIEIIALSWTDREMDIEFN